MATLTSQILSGRDLNNTTKLYVEVWLKNANQDHLLGATTTNAEGNFSIIYEERDFTPNPGGDGHQVYLKIYQEAILIKNTVDNPVVILRNTIPTISITQSQNGRLSANLVQGVIATPKGRGISNLIVR